VFPDTGPVYGKELITIFGSGFTNPSLINKGDLNPVATVGGVPCLNTTLVSATQLECEVPPGTGGKKEVVVTIGTAVTEPRSLFYTYVGPVVESVSPAKGPTYGNYTLTVLGERLGSVKALPTINLGPLSCLNTKFISSKKLTCIVPAGSIKDSLPVIVTVGPAQSDTNAKSRNSFT
jgi:hypothetical protein